MYTAKPETESKTPFEKAREALIPMAYEKISLIDPTIKVKSIVPKNYQEIKFDHLLLKHYEFTGDCYFVITNSTWDQIVDTSGNFISLVSKAEMKDIIIYKHASCENFDDVYAFTDFGGTKTKLTGSYKVPISEFTPINLVEVLPPIPTSQPTLFDFFDSEKEEQSDKDENINALTIKDLYAIIQNVPVSNKQWLNNVIKKTNVIRTKEN